MKRCKLKQGENNTLRITDRNNHFIGEYKNGVLYVYCKRCGFCHPVPGFTMNDNTAA